MDARFCVGYSGKFDDLRKIIAASPKVTSVYTGGLTGRIAGGRPSYMDTFDELARQVGYAHENGVEVELALNAPGNVPDGTDKAWWDNLTRYLTDLEQTGVDSLIVSHPLIMGQIKSKTRLKLSVSTICEIKTARSALYYEKMGGDVIIPSMNANLDMESLRLMKKSLSRAKLRIMVNERCLGDCPWRTAHFSQNSERGSNQTYSYDQYYLNCHRMFYENPWLLLSNNAIRPEDLTHYEDITLDFKIVGRLAPVEDTLARIRAYADGNFDGNFVRLLISQFKNIIHIPNKSLDGLIEKKFTCNKVCDTCQYCKNLFERTGSVHS